MVTNNKNLKWIALLTVGIIGIYFIASIAIYRIPAGDEPESFEGFVLYEPLDNTSTNRRFFEERLMGNRLVRLDDESVWYVSESDYTILWPENLDEMHQRGYTVKTELKAQKLLFGGYSIAEIYELDIINEAPAGSNSGI
jgi:hypothetical protein